MKRAWAVLAGATLAFGFISGCATTSGPAAPAAPLADDAAVDCRLPPQIRRLGAQATYHAPGRVVRTTARDCRLRGGQARALAGSAPSAPLAPPGGAMAVMVGGDGGEAACAVSGRVVGLRSGSTLNVRTGPGTGHARIDALTNGRRLYVCDGSQDEEWLGVVYPERSGQDCGVAAARADGRPYAGPCRAGWVNAGWVQTD